MDEAPEVIVAFGIVVTAVPDNQNRRSVPVVSLTAIVLVTDTHMLLLIEPLEYTIQCGLAPLYIVPATMVHAREIQA